MINNFKMKLLNIIPRKLRNLIVEYSNILLLIIVVFIIFIIPILPVENKGQLYSIFYSVVFFVSLTVLDSKRNLLIYAALFAFFTEWIAEINQASGLLLISRLANIFFFVVIVIKMILQIASYKRVTLVVIVEAVTGYLLMGMMFTVLVLMVLTSVEGAYNFGINEGDAVTNVTYFTIVTMTTLGYGEMLPLLPISKSLTMFITICGQLYLAIIIGTLIGKFLSQDQDHKQQIP